MTTKRENENNEYIKIWVLMLCLTLFAYILSTIKLFNIFHISPLIIAVLLGGIFGNLAKKQVKTIEATNVVKIGTKQILRLGIILYGFKITLTDIAMVGFSGIFLGFFIVFSTFFLSYILGQLMGIDKKSSVLIGSGSSICGAAAVLATQSTIDAENEKVAIAVCTVVIFGTIGMFAYPLLYNMEILNLDEYKMGILMGSTLHEVAHVVAAGSGVGGEAALISVIMKMIRVLMLVPFLFMLIFLNKFLVLNSLDNKKNIKENIPYFAIWFLIVIVFSSYLPKDFRTELLPIINYIDVFLLSFAMLSLGLGIKKDIFKKAGKKPFVLATFLAIWLFVSGYAMVLILY